jgi:CRP-like cAMP-binding protein
MEDIYEFFKCKTVKSGEVLWKEGDQSDYVAIICSGRIEIKKQTEIKGKHVVVGIYKRGAVVGAIGILDSIPRATTAVAREEVSLVLITRENFEELMENHPELGVKLLKGMLLSVSMRLRKSFERLSKFF